MVPDNSCAREIGNSDGKATEAVKDLSGWICHNYEYKDGLTHLKLQKLLFYCYGALLAADLEDEVGSELIFEPWEHGPVNRELYVIFRNKGSSVINPEDCPQAGNFSKRVTTVLRDALTVYGAMSAWSLREQTHAEKPWKLAYEKQETTIDPVKLKKYFKQKFAPGSVAAPEYLFKLSSFKIDGIPVQNYESLHSLAVAVDRVFSEYKKTV